MPKSLPPIELLHELFIYCDVTGRFIRRISTSANARAGDVVGTVDGKGYLHVSIGKKFYRLHRIAYAMFYGEEPELVDHIDGDRKNNAIWNLRSADSKQNAGNARLARNNRSGFRGVSFNTRSQLWAAQIKINGQQTHLGRFACPKEAARRYNDAATSHFGEFAKLNKID